MNSLLNKINQQSCLFWTTQELTVEEAIRPSEIYLQVLTTSVASQLKPKELFIAGPKIPRNQDLATVHLRRVSDDNNLQKFVSDFSLIIFVDAIPAFITKYANQKWLYLCTQSSLKFSPELFTHFERVLAVSEAHKTRLILAHAPQEKLEILPLCFNSHQNPASATPRQTKSIAAILPENDFGNCALFTQTFDLIKSAYPGAQLSFSLLPDLGEQQSTSRSSSIMHNAKNDEAITYSSPKKIESLRQLFLRHEIVWMPVNANCNSAIPYYSMLAQSCGCIPLVEDWFGSGASIEPGRSGLLYSEANPAVLAEVSKAAFSALEKSPAIRDYAASFVREFFPPTYQLSEFLRILGTLFILDAA